MYIYKVTNLLPTMDFRTIKYYQQSPVMTVIDDPKYILVQDWIHLKFKQ